MSAMFPIDTRQPLAKHPLNAGRVAWWLGVRGTNGGPKLPDICNRYPASLINEARWDYHGIGLNLNGSNQYADTSATGAPSGSLAVTLVPGFDPDTSARYVIDAQNPRTLLYQNTQATGAYGLYINNTFVSDNSTGLVLSPPKGMPTRVMVTWGGTTVQVYRNGVLFADFTATVGATSGAIRFGSRFNGQDYWLGGLRDISLWSRKLNAADALAEYTQSNSGYPSLLRRVSPWPAAIPASAPPATSGLLLRRRRACA